MKYVSVSELAEKLSLTERAIRNRCIAGKFPSAKKEGKNWLIPEEDTLDMNDYDYAKKILDLIDKSPVSFYVIKNVEEILTSAGYRKINNENLDEVKPGDKIYFVRNGSSLIALNIGKDIKEDNYRFNIVASHSDSPTFKLKPEVDSKTDIYNKINVEPYGGMICSTWLDRPLSIAGRVIYKNDDAIKSSLVNIDKDLLVIPNVCIHFNRTVNTGYAYNMASDMQPLFAQHLENLSLKDLLAKELNIQKEDIYNFDLFLYNRNKSVIYSANNEEGFISSGRLDDQECVFASLDAFVNSENNIAINTLFISDNEEVGSTTQQGANSDFLDIIFNKVYRNLGFSQSSYVKAINNSFLISADNAHAVHPNNPGLTDSNNKVYMNKGIAIKFNAAQSYTSDALSASVMQEICKKANVPYQFFTNRSDIRGGGTLGNILLTHVSLKSVDIGLPQLAMHSSYETAGIKDLRYLFLSLKEFYNSNIIFGDDYLKIIK